MWQSGWKGEYLDANVDLHDGPNGKQEVQSESKSHQIKKKDTLYIYIQSGVIINGILKHFTIVPA